MSLIDSVPDVQEDEGCNIFDDGYDSVFNLEALASEPLAMMS